MPEIDWNRWGCFGILPEPTKAGPAIVAGSARGWLGELVKARGMFPNAAIFAVNRVGIALHEESDFWVSVHPEKFFPQREWKHTVTISDKPDSNLDLWERPCVDIVYEIATMGGSSSLLATCVALAMGFDQVLLAGVHISDGGYKWMADRWIHYEPILRGRVHSFAPDHVWTREYFGGPI